MIHIFGSKRANDNLNFNPKVIEPNTNRAIQKTLLFYELKIESLKHFELYFYGQGLKVKFTLAFH